MTLLQPDYSRIWGLDISHWNGLTDLAAAKARGCSFVFIKACDGAVPTRYFQENKERAKVDGLPWGAYLWLYPGNKVPVGTQVNAWWNLVKDDYPPLGVCIDVEWTKYAGLPANPTSGDLISALDKFTALSSKKPMIYTARGYSDQYLTSFTNYDAYGLWVAHYGVMAPALPKGATTYRYHQFTDKLDGSIAPSENLALDGNYFNGTRTEFDALVKGTGGSMYNGVVNVASLNVRSGAGTTYSIVDSVKLGDKLQASEVVNGWWHLATVNGVARTGWVSGQYVTVTSTPPPVEEVTVTVDVAADVDGVRYEAKNVPLAKV